MILETERLVLRPWRETDAADLYEYAKDGRIGPIAGWPVHKNVDESLEVIRTIFAQDGVYAVTLKGDDRAIGSIGLHRGTHSNIPIGEDEGEVGYWIGVPFWGRGLIPEAVRELMRHAFEDLQLTALWCGYFDGNEKSKRVQEKCGFRHHRTDADKPWPLMNDVRTEHISRITKEEWRALNGRYHRNILIEGFGPEGQQKLQQAKVLVVGAGGLGAPALLYLAAAGVGTLGIIDFDTVDETNLQRQIIHFTADVGKSKVQSAAAKIAALNPNVKINAYRELFTEANAAELVRQYDFVLDCCDNYTAKFLINDVCEAGEVAFSHGAVLAMKGEAMTWTPGHVTYRGVFGAPPPEGSMPTAAEAGILGAIAGVIGSIQAAEAIKFITGVGELIVDRMLIFDGRKMQFYSLDCKAMSQSFQTTS